MKSNKSEKALISNIEKNIEQIRRIPIYRGPPTNSQVEIDLKVSNRKSNSPFKASSYPKVYLSSNLEQKIKDLKLLQNILESPQKNPRQKRKNSIIVKTNKTPKLYLLVSSTPNYLTKISHESGCSCCKKRSFSFEASFDKIIQEKKQKTINAQEEFQRLCKRPKTVGKESICYMTTSSISENVGFNMHNAKKSVIHKRIRKNV